MNAEANLKSPRDLARLVARPEVGHRGIGSERAIQMSLAWAVGAAVLAIVAWMIANLALRWITLD